MKTRTRIFYFLLVCISIGMVIPVFAVSPDKTKGDKIKVENLTSPSPPSPWTLTIDVTDPNDSCAAYINCSLEFFVQPASSNCEAVLAYPSISIPIIWGTTSYTHSIPDYIPCVEVNIVPQPGTHCTGYNLNSCCSCIGSEPCKLRICP